MDTNRNKITAEGKNPTADRCRITKNKCKPTTKRQDHIETQNTYKERQAGAKTITKRCKKDKLLQRHTKLSQRSKTTSHKTTAKRSKMTQKRQKMTQTKLQRSKTSTNRSKVDNKET